MRISGKPSVGGSTGVGSSGSAPVKAPSTPGPVGHVQAADAVDVSAPAQLLAVAQAEIAQVPDIRMEKVEALRAAIDSDGYHPDGEAVADGIVREHRPFSTGP